eukprot:TRINITY_DN2607_c4_g1_i1.p1 TRINITY_DN2607_c4_g1~~TRINITY_DN2607_c4_g1_i1.p1  ORF type:complete len:103 (+),score=0.09 TRINITY_DN2607_c4_g1_i1:1006-1314(+)
MAFLRKKKRRSFRKRIRSRGIVDVICVVPPPPSPHIKKKIKIRFEMKDFFYVRHHPLAAQRSLARSGCFFFLLYYCVFLSFLSPFLSLPRPFRCSLQLEYRT